MNYRNIMTYNLRNYLSTQHSLKFDMTFKSTVFESVILSFPLVLRNIKQYQTEYL